MVLGFLGQRYANQPDFDQPLKFQSVTVSGTFPATFQLDIFDLPDPTVPAQIEGSLESTVTGDLETYRISAAGIYVVSADSDLEGDPANVRILGWDPDHLIFYSDLSKPDIGLSFGGDYVFGKFRQGYDLATGTSRTPAQYELDTQCQSDLELVWLPMALDGVASGSAESAVIWDEYRRKVIEECDGGRSDHVEPSPLGFDTPLSVVMVDDPDATLGVLHIRSAYPE